MTSEARVVALDRVRPGNVGRRSGDLLDVVFGCLVCDHEGPAAPREPAGAETGRGLWLAAQLTDELSITSGPDSTIVSLYIRFE